MRAGFTMEPHSATRFVRPSPEDERRNIRAVLAGASLELSSQDPAEIDACADLLEPGTAVYISMPPGQTYHGNVALATRLRRAGFRPVPHVAARRIASRDALEEYLARAAKMKGHGLPVRIGLSGPASLPRLLRFAALCGIGNSVRALKTRPRAITRLLVEAGPEAVVRDIARPGIAAISGIHFFCFGGLLRTARWLRAVREGRFELTRDGGFRGGAP